MLYVVDLLTWFDWALTALFIYNVYRNFLLVDYGTQATGWLKNRAIGHSKVKKKDTDVAGSVIV